MHLQPEDIYESAFISEKWPVVLHELAELGGAKGGGLFTANQDVSNWTSSETLLETMQAFVAGKVLQGMGQRPRVFEKGQHGFITEQDIFTDEELDNHPLYRDFLRPKGLGWSARTAVRMPTGDNIIVTLERSLSDGPIKPEQLAAINTLRPHLARAALMSARLQLERAKAAADALAMIGLPALLFDHHARVLGANELIEKLPDFIVFRAHERVALRDTRANMLFMQAVAAAAKREHQFPLSFSVCDNEGIAKHVAHVIPICGQSQDVFIRTTGILTLTPVSAPQMPAADLVQSLFDLTPAEARVARHVARGETIDAFAETNAVSINTVRAQLKNVLAKTGCHRQAEVAALLSGLTVVRTT
jgi:DNA-binding CsgD family transcriptional regulator